ncbi:MAG: drug/metabolite transporter (DMT)-like permease [Candidatus Latescibacterota bacterium]|jgi:drug/metabolite transporter (DMT)-like permease
MVAKFSLRADALLLLTAIIWGFAFVAQRLGMEHIGPFLFNGVRFALGCIPLLPFVYRNANGKLGQQLRRTAPAAALAGSVLFAGASLQQVGIVYTTAGKAGFITGLYVVLVPLLGLALGTRTQWSTWLGALAAACGLYLLSIEPPFSIGLGDGLVLIGALFWAIHVLIISRIARKHDWALLALGQFFTCALLSLIVAIFSEDIALGPVVDAAWPILYGGLLSVGLAYTLQVVAQRQAPPAHAAVILSFETVVAALGGWMLLGELLPPRGLFGCALMFAGILVSQWSAQPIIEIETKPTETKQEEPAA